MDPEKVLIMMTSGPETPRRCATPFFYASLATAMDYDVTMYFTIDGTLLLVPGVAETVFPREGGQPVSYFMQQALENGVKFMACTASTELHGLEPEQLLPNVQMAGGAAMLELAAESKIVLSF